MHRIDTSTAQIDKFGAAKNGFTSGNPQAGVPATEVSAEILDAMQEEICAVIEAAGLALDKAKNNQLLAAVQAAIYPVGAPIPWPRATPPTGFLLVNGQSFNLAAYPKLAQAYPSGTLPDLRGEFIRGWDNGRGIDSGRVLLNAQGDSFKQHNHGFGLYDFTPPPNQGYPLPTVSATHGGATKYVPVENTYAGGAETRPRNIAFNYIVRAA